MKLIERNQYLDFLIRHKDKQIIKVISGMRRCGKSTMFVLYHEYLIQHGVKDNQIIWINFEDLKFEHLKDYHVLYDHINKLLRSEKKYYIFLDEIQHVANFEKAIDSLFIKPNVDLYITGSNAYFMSSTLATLLSGRYVELKMLPLSFKEYCQGIDAFTPSLNWSIEKKYENYISTSSLPYVLNLYDKPNELDEYLLGIYNTVLLKDIITRHKIVDVLALESVAKFIFDNIGNLCSCSKISNTMKSYGRNVDVKTIEKYLFALTESLILYKAPRYNIKGKQLLASLEKYYVADIGLRNLMLTNKISDQGRILENIVYLELIRRGYTVYVGKVLDAEVDFVATKGNKIEYYQVCTSVLDELTLARELKSLNKIDDQHTKFLLTLDVVGTNANYDGIKQYNVLDWLLDK